MDVKLEIGDSDDVGGEVSLLPITSGMDIGVPDVNHVGDSRGADDTGTEGCLVVLAVDGVADQDVIGKSLELGESPAASGSESTSLMEMSEDHTQELEKPFDPVTQSWFTTKYSKDSLSEQGHKWKQGMWSRDEIELLERNIENYLREHQMRDASEVIFNNSKENRKNFYRSIAQGLQRPLFAVYRRVIRMYDQKNHVGRYSAEDIKKLKELRARHGNDWALIGNELGRSASSVKDKFRLLKDACNRGKWSVEEENLLTEAVFNISGTRPGESVTTGISWSQVAECVGTRTEKQCRAKWLNYLNWKQTGGVEWSRVDDLMLLNRIGETDVVIESDLDWDDLAKNWKSVRSPQWLRSKWWSLKRQVPAYDDVSLKALLNHLKAVHCRKRLREERSSLTVLGKESSLDLSQAGQLKNGTLTVQVPIQFGAASGVEGLETSDNSSLQSLMLPQSTLSDLSPTGAFLTGQGMTTVHQDNHIIIQVTTVQASEGASSGAGGNARHIIITARNPRQTVPSLDQDETDICDHMQHPCTAAELSDAASAIVHNSQDLATGSDHMASSIGQSEVSAVEEQPISSQAQLIGTDAVLSQQNVSSADMVGGSEPEATLVVVSTAPSSDELSQPTTGTVEDAQLGGGVFTLSGPLPVLQAQGDEHTLMGSPSHLEAPHHHSDEPEEEEEDVEIKVEVEVDLTGEDTVETKNQLSGIRRRKRSRRR